MSSGSWILYIYSVEQQSDDWILEHVLNRFKMNQNSPAIELFMVLGFGCYVNDYIRRSPLARLASLMTYELKL